MKKSEKKAEAPSKGGATSEPINGATNDAAVDIIAGLPYFAKVRVVGTSPFLFHRWSCEAVAEKAAAKKNSKGKKSDNIESYVYRADDGTVAVPTEYLRQSLIGAARFMQDPRSPRKSAKDLFTAGVVATEELVSFRLENGKTTDTWEYLDRRRALVQRNAITRERPAFRKGWSFEVVFNVLLAEYIDPTMLQSALSNAGRFVGVGDFRPSFGRFRVDHFEVMSLDDIDAAAQ